VQEKEIVTTLTVRGQVTVPVEVQRLLGVKPRDKLTFAIAGGEVKLLPARFTLESLAGSVQPPTNTEDLEGLIQEAKEEHAQRVRARLDGQ
jgi:bifunctional DNA-binding transcriptional regulator/antitoxin component of YhaV-PrlF toxin-antitoxin module